jgi:hypothetical protein
MKINLDRLLQKRKQLEQQILEAQQLEKQMARVQRILFSVLEKHPQLAVADEQLLQKSLDEAFTKIVQELSPA